MKSPASLSSLQSSFPPASPRTFTSRHILTSKMGSSPVPQPTMSPALTSHQLQAVASTSQRRKYHSPLPFHTAQVFENWEHWPIRVTRADPNVVNNSQDSVEILFKRVDRNSRVVNVHSNDMMVPINASEEISAKFSWHEDELINEFQRTFDEIGKDNRFFGFFCVWLSSIPTLIDTK
ncbi:hypothetical protein O181_026161 [Austropuccinia psidii MF-1]|uniref:Uncharacterized protein n=1 Tax=Austropuccinia psidii MF-1 TaxID=1389203 RepID=A0A9Q3H085_9BASI|nr:hypothetical protein [Austropuccinia psidii MF-1]